VEDSGERVKVADVPAGQVRAGGFVPVEDAIIATKITRGERIGRLDQEMWAPAGFDRDVAGDAPDTRV
jgi:hypothetical protein